MTSPEAVAIDVIVNAGASVGTLNEVRAGVTGVGTAATETAVASTAAMDRVTSSFSTAAVGARGFGSAAVAAGAEAEAGLTRAETAARATADTFRALTAGLVGAVAIGGGIELVKKFAEAAADDAQGVRLVGYAFGDAGEAVLKFSETANTAFGLSAAKANTLASELGNYFSGYGIYGEQAANLATELVGREADIAKATGKSIDDVQSAIESAFRGKGLAAQALGIKIDPAALSKEALAQGSISDLKDTLDPGAKALAAVGLVMDQTSNKAGDFAKSINTTQTQTQILTATMDNFAGQMGRAVYPSLIAVGNILLATVVPAVKIVGDVLAPVLSAFGDLPPFVQNVVGVFGVLLLLRGPLNAMFSGIVNAVTGLVTKLAASSAGVQTFALETEAEAEAATAAAAAEWRHAAGLTAVGEAAVLAAGDVEAAAVAVDSAAEGFTLLSGPIGITVLAVGAVVGALTLFGSHEADAATQVRDFSAAIDENTGKLGANANSVISTADVTTVVDYVVKLGGAYGTYTNAVEGHTDAQKTLVDQIQKSATSAIDASPAWQELSKSQAAAGLTASGVAATLLAGGQGAQNLKAIFAGNGGLAKDFADVTGSITTQQGVLNQYHSDLTSITTSLKEKAGALEENTAAQDRDTKSQDQYLASVVKGTSAQDLVTQKTKLQFDAMTAENFAYVTAAAAADSMAASTKSLADQMTAVNTQTTLVTAALDKLAGRNPTVEQAMSDESTALQAIGTKYGLGTVDAQGNSAAQHLGAGVLNADGSANISTAQGTDLRSTVLTARTGIAEASQAAYSGVLDTEGKTVQGYADAKSAAKAAATQGVAGFLNSFAQVFGSRAMAAKLAGAYGLDPTQVLSAITVARVTAATTDPAIATIQATLDANDLHAAAKGMATGGWVTGGIPGVDSVPIMAQQGEFVVKASAASQAAPYLHALNNGGHGYATGGSVTPNGPDRWNVAGSGSTGGKNITLAPGAITVTIDATGASAGQLDDLAKTFRQELEQAFLDDLERRL